MAGLKRKDAPVPKSQTNYHKKQKKATDQYQRTGSALAKETETDSDPIIESDTPEQSGDDDGVSWPSDNEVSSSLPDQSTKKDGGVKLISESADKYSTPSIRKKSSSEINRGMSLSRIAFRV